MGLQNLTDMFSGSIIDYDTLLKNEQANRKQVGDAFAESMKALNNNYDIFNRKTKYNDVKNKLEDVNRYNGIKKSVDEDKDFVSKYEQNNSRKIVDKEGYTNPFSKIATDDEERVKALQQELIKERIIPATYKGKDGKEHSNVDGIWGPTTEDGWKTYLERHPNVAEKSHVEIKPVLSLRDKNKPLTLADKDFGSDARNQEAMDEYNQYLERKNNIKVNSKYLEDNAENYNNLMRDYGWMLENPELTDTIAEEYIRTGDPTKFIQLQQNYRQAQLERERLANERAVKGANARKEAQEKSLKGRKLQARDSLIQATTMVANNAGIPTTVKDKLLDVIIYGVETEADEALLNEYGSKLSNQGLLFDGTGLMGYYGLAPEDISEIRIAEHELDKLGGKGEKGRTTPTKPKATF